MKRLVIVSNRLPVSVEKRKGNLHFRSSIGGLATGLRAFYESYDCIWIGWPGITSDKINKKEKKYIEKKLISDFNCYPVFLSKSEVERYYNGFCNKTIWPLFHYFAQYAVHDERLWKSYEKVNELFYDATVKIINEGDIIWIHDYHLMLLPRLIREKISEAKIGFFLHTPFPSSEIFRLLPWRKKILDGLLGADLIGFHTYDYVRHFLISVHYLLGYEHSFGQIKLEDRIIKVDVFPMGIDYERFSSSIQDQKVKREVKKFRKKLGDHKIILSIDRLDYTKGIEQRLKAFSVFLERNPKYKGKITFILVAVPSRTKVEHYENLKKQIDELVGRINGKYASIGWTPIFYLYRSLPFHSLVALYNISDIALITPLRDGMNLIAKEYVATKTDGKGVLILSEMAGAAKELGEALIISPYDKEDIIKALEEALTMLEEEQIKRNKIMQKRLRRYNIARWAEEFIDRLLDTKKLQKEMHAKRLSFEMKRKLIKDYKKSKQRLILLDYDGAFIPFFKGPEVAKLNAELLTLLERLSKDSKNEVTLLSGRDKYTIEKWFSTLPMGKVAEHGAWIKEKGKDWEMIEPLTNEWKKDILPILELYVDRTPGSFIEDKEFSLVWHYRKVSPELGLIRARELIDTLENLTTNLNIQVLEGSKVIEVKNSGINKGRAALRWISREKWDFILAIGDDQTDEDVFSVLPETAYSIKVGLGPSQAKFNLNSQRNVISLLEELISREEEDLKEEF
jgi:trehalose 6-phosphate synthase/phosphatase